MRKIGSLSTIVPGEKLSKPDIDYPQIGEKVARGHYAIRISGCAGKCEVAIDDGTWRSCRCADGYCWYDWYPTEIGRHRICARVRSGNKWLKVQRTGEVE